MLDDRGRIGGVMTLFCVDAERFICMLEGVSADDFEARYELYVVLDDVEIERLAGWRAATIQGVALPVEVGLPVASRDRSGLGGQDMVGPVDEVEGVLGASGLPAVDDSVLDRLRVRVGDPRWPVDFGDRRLPHEMGMREAFLSFEKGCYLGQETVNRVDVMGQVKRSLAGVRLPDEADVAELFVGERSVGTVTTAVTDPELGRIGLAVLRVPHDTAGSELVATWYGRSGPARVCGLPFGPEPR